MKIIYKSEVRNYILETYSEINSLQNKDLTVAIKLISILLPSPLKLVILLPVLVQVKEPLQLLAFFIEKEIFTFDPETQEIDLKIPPAFDLILFDPPEMDEEVEMRYGMRHQPKRGLDGCKEMGEMLGRKKFRLTSVSRKIPKSYSKSEKEIIELTLNELGDETFRFHHFMDTRGRMYCQGYGVNYQGDPWHKACLELV